MRSIALVAFAVVVGLCGANVVSPSWAAECASGSTMIVVAHQDDDVTFLNPDQSADIAAGKCVRVVYVTAGDGGEALDHWAPREQAAKRAHEVMAGVSEAPTVDGSLQVLGRTLAHRTLAGAPQIDMVFMRLPEGKPNGAGFDRNAGESLARLASGEITTISTTPDAATDGLAAAATYTKAELTDTLLGLMEQFRPDKLRVQNFDAAASAPDDHADHVAGARLAAAAAETYAQNNDLALDGLLVGYRGEDVADYAQNVSGTTLQATLASFAAYAAVDDRACANRDCSSYFEDVKTFRGYPRWLRRQYRLDQSTPPVGATAIRVRAAGDDADKCVGLESKDAAAGLQLRIEPCAGGQGQRWLYSYKAGTIRPEGDKRLCVRTRAYPPQDYTKIDLARCDGSPAQTWRMMSSGEFVHASGRCLEMKNADNGAPLSARDCKYKQQQLWGYGSPATPIAPVRTFYKVYIDYFRIGALKGDYAVDRPVTTSRGTGNVELAWRFPPGGQMRAFDGKCVDTRTPAAPNGETAIMRQCDRTDPMNASPSQTWQYVKRRVVNRQDGVERCLTIVNTDVIDGAEIWICRSTRGQIWKSYPPARQ